MRSVQLLARQAQALEVLHEIRFERRAVEIRRIREELVGRDAAAARYLVDRADRITQRIAECARRLRDEATAGEAVDVARRLDDRRAVEIASVAAREIIEGAPAVGGVERAIREADPGVDPEPELVVGEIAVAHVEHDGLAERAEPDRVGATFREEIFGARVGNLFSRGGRLRRS